MADWHAGMAGGDSLPQIWTTGIDRDFVIAVLALVSFSAATVWLCLSTDPSACANAIKARLGKGPMAESTSRQPSREVTSDSYISSNADPLASRKS